MKVVHSNELFAVLKDLGLDFPEDCFSITIHMHALEKVKITTESYLPKFDGNDPAEDAYVIGGKGSGQGWAQTKRYKLIEDTGEDDEHKPNASD